MNETLEHLIRRLSQDEKLRGIGEEATRQGFILPILESLDWNVRDVREVEPEYKIGDDKVDYCLRIGEKVAVLLEVKRPSEDLGGLPEEQLLRYAWREAVDLAVLANGFTWWFYLPRAECNWQERKFFTIDICKQDAEQATEHFRQFLAHDSVEDGSAVTNAQRVKASRDKEIVIRQTFPEVWQELLRGPDEHFLDILADRIESKCGHRPDLAILGGLVRQRLAGVLVDPGLRQEDKNKSGTGPSDTQGKKKGKQKGARISIDSRIIAADSVSDMYKQALEYLCESGLIDRIAPRLPYATGSKRYLLAREPRHCRGNSFIVPVEHSGYYMEAHKEYGQAIRELAKMLKPYGVVVTQCS